MSQGYQSKLGIDTTNPVAKGFEFEACNLTRQSQILDFSGMRGTRSRLSERTRFGNYSVSGTIELYPSPEDLALLLPWILGAAAVDNTFALAETLSSRYATVDKITKVCTYAGVYVNKATFSGAEGQSMKLSLDLIGQTETIANSGTFPSVTYSNTAPFMFAESTLTLLSSSRSVKSWSVVIDNMLEASFYNSQTATTIKPKDRAVTFSAVVPYTDADLYNQALAGAAATLALSPPSPMNGYSLSFAFATLQFPANGPVVPGRSELTLNLEGVARKVSTTSELIITLDSSP